MKKLKYLILALALIPSALFAYTVQQGDTPYELWGTNWKTELSKYGIQDPRRLPVGLEVDLEDDLFGAVILPEDSYDTFLTAPLSTSATEVFVNVTPSFVSSSIYTLFASDGRTVREKLYCTGTSASPNKLTGCVRGLSEGPVSGVIDETAGTGVSHSRNARIAITDNINFSGKALSILGGNQPTGANNFDLGTASSTDGNKCFRFDTGDTDTQICANDGTGELYWTTDGGSNTYLFTSSTISQLTASSTLGIQVVGGEIGINASSTTGMGFDSDGALYQAIGNALEYTGNAIGVSTSTIVEQIATSTPTASKIPIADGSGKIDDDWLNVDVTSQSTFLATAGENITAGNAVSVGDGALEIRGTGDFTGSPTSETITDTRWWSNSYISSENAISIKTVRVTSAPTGVFLTASFATPVPVSPSTEYAIVMRRVVGQLIVSIRTRSGDTPTGADIGGYTAVSTLGDGTWVRRDVALLTVTGGVTGTGALSTNSGSTWGSTGSGYYSVGANISGMEFEVTEITNEVGKLYKSDASINNIFANNFVGFATENINSDETGVVRTSNVDDNQTGLTPGVIYYLSDTAGAISTSAGTVSKKVGLSLSATQILIKNDN